MSRKNININIAGIPISIAVEEEIVEYIREGAKIINDEVRGLSEKKSEKERGFFLAVVALRIAASYIGIKDEIKKIDALNEKLDNLVVDRHK